MNYLASLCDNDALRMSLSVDIHPESEETKFLLHMAMIMNTSVEKLKYPYISID